MDKTYFMTRLFSDEELQEKVSEKMQECKDCGSAELKTEDMDLKFADTGDEIIVEDQTNDEVTSLSDPDGEGNVEAEKVEIEETPESTETTEKTTEEATKETTEEATEEVKKESETQPDVKTEVVEGEDGEHIDGKSQPDVEVTVTDGSGVNDAEKAGLKNFSIKFAAGTDPAYIAAVTRAFADAAAKVDANLENQGEEMLEVATEGEKEFADTPEGDVKYNVAELSKAVDKLEETKDPELAKEIKEIASEVKKEAEKLEKEGADMAEVKAQCATFSDAADAILNEEANKDAYEAGKLSEKANEEETKAEEDKAECNKNFSACLEAEADLFSVAPHKNFTQKEDRTFSEGGIQKPTSNNSCLTATWE